MTIPVGLPQPPNYPLFLCLFLQDCTSLLVANYPYGYSYGIAPNSQLPTIAMAIPTGLLQPPIRQSFLVSVTICSYAYSCRIAPASYLPNIPMAIPTGLPGLLVASTIYSYGYPYGFAPAS